MDDDDGHPVSNNVVILLIAMGSAAFVVSMYHVIGICLCNQRRTEEQALPTRSAPSIADMIPTHKYHKKEVNHQVSDDGGDESDTCAVCLGDFEEGEELRSLPECMHSFHVSCIDMWLNSHSSCPVCRATATPSVEMQHSDHHYLSYAHHHHTINMPQFDVVQSGFVIRR
ncbi:hypothetical protein VNO77_40377 [Canavalia gladiata]|uniref:RING-type domain-containing protein n=1 Tax=Canavalia gladiata TaxID=3824 RepID=A0AAN9K0L4_CANGL